MQLPANVPCGADGVDEICRSLLKEAFCMQAVGRELNVAALQKVPRHHRADLTVVDAHEGEIVAKVCGAQFDGGQPGGGNDVGCFLREGAGENAVALPVLEPRRR